MSWLTDRWRPWVAAASVAGGLYTMAWWNTGTARGAIGASGLDALPEGREVVLSLLRVESIPSPDAMVVGHAALHIPVRADTAERVVGEEITIGGIIEDGAVRAIWVQPAPDRPLKYALGIVGVLAGVGLWVGSVRLTRDGLVLRG